MAPEVTQVIEMSETAKIVSFLDQLLGDTSIPKNVRSAIASAKDRLDKDGGEAGIAAAIYALDEVSNDINLPMHARTKIWNVLSELEAMKSH